jgi:hypothetical protein
MAARRLISYALALVLSLVWLGASVVWGSMMLMASAMANDSGSKPAEQVATLILVTTAGSFVIGLGGIAGGIALIRAKSVGTKVLWFVAPLLAGLAIQVLAAWSFFA